MVMTTWSWLLFCAFAVRVCILFLFLYSSNYPQQLPKQTKNIQLLWSSRPTNTQKHKLTLHRSSWHQHHFNDVDQSTGVNRYSYEGIKIKYMHVLQTFKSAIDFRWSLPLNYYFLSFFFWNKHIPSKFSVLYHSKFYIKYCFL